MWSWVDDAESGHGIHSEFPAGGGKSWRRIAGARDSVGRVTTVAARRDHVAAVTNGRALGAVVLAVIGWSASTLFVRRTLTAPAYR